MVNCVHLRNVWGKHFHFCSSSTQVNKDSEVTNVHTENVQNSLHFFPTFFHVNFDIQIPLTCSKKKKSYNDTLIFIYIYHQYRNNPMCDLILCTYHVYCVIQYASQCPKSEAVFPVTVYQVPIFSAWSTGGHWLQPITFSWEGSLELTAQLCIY